MNTQNRDMENMITTARRISETKCAEVGIKMALLDPAKVPPSVQPLLQHAQILGVGDDGTRNEIFEEVPKEYLDLVRSAVNKAAGLFEWYRQAETTDARHTPEVAAIGWMLFGLNLG